MIAIPRLVARIPILRGVFRLVLTAWADLMHGRYVVDRRLGLTLLLDRTNDVDWQIHVKGAWEPQSVARLFALANAERRHCPDGAVFLDIGAHWGFYALLAHKTGWFQRIVAFEPDPANYAQLQANLFLNDAANAIEALKLAASDREATFGLALQTHRNRGGTQLVSVDQSPQVTCRAVPIASVLDFAGKLLVVKMDIESHEEEALEGLLSLLKKNHSVLQVEIWRGAEARDADRPNRVIKRLGQHGLRHLGIIDSDYFFVSERPAG